MPEPVPGPADPGAAAPTARPGSRPPVAPVSPDDLHVHTVDDGATSVVVGPDGSLWELDAPPAEVLEATATLADLAGQCPSSAPPAVGAEDVVCDSVAAAGRAAAAVGAGARPTTLCWPFAGRWHRLLVHADDAAQLHATASACLLATVPQARLAAALRQDPARMGTAPQRVSSTPPPPAGVLQRWERDRWVDHALDPAPVVDPVTGVLHRISPRRADPSLPPGFLHLHAELPHLSSVDPSFQPDPIAPAGALVDPATAAAAPGRSAGRVHPAAHEAAVRSGVEHRCGTWTGQGRLRRATAAGLAAQDERLLAVDDWPPHDPALVDQEGFPFVPFDHDEPCWWLAGDEAGRRCWVPLSLVHAGWLSADLTDLRPHNYHNLVGLAAGRDAATAAELGAAHAIAHDAVAVWWASDAPLPPADLPASVTRAWGDSDLRLSLRAVPARVPVPVRLAAVDDPARDVVTLGFAAHAAPQRAAELAVVQALLQHASARDLLAVDSRIRRGPELGVGGAAGLAPHDPDRRYAEAFGPDHRGLIDPMCHLQLGLDPRVTARVRQRLHPAAAGWPTPDTAPNGGGGTIRSAVDASGLRRITLDVTDDRTAAAGWHAVRTIVPGLARIQPAAFPLARRSLVEAMADRGWSPGCHQPYPGW